MPAYFVTGATGLLGRQVLARLLADRSVTVHALVREGSVGRLRTLAGNLRAGKRLVPVIGDLTADGLGLDDAAVAALRGSIDEVFHLAAVYDFAAPAEVTALANVEGTRRVVALAGLLGAARLHHVSSVAVAGTATGFFSEDDFDLGQPLPTPYHQTKFEGERIVREDCPIPWRIYRPSVIVGDSQTGEMDKIDGPYYFLPLLAGAGDLPAARQFRLVMPSLGNTNVVPVDYVADAMVALARRPGLDGRAFHLVNPQMQPLSEVYNALAKAAGAPTIALGLPAVPGLGNPAAAGLSLLRRVPVLREVTDLTLARLGIPAEAVEYSAFTPQFVSLKTRTELEAADVAPPPPLSDYASVLYEYWSRHLDPLRARRRRAGGPLAGRTVAVTGASSGIGRATSLEIARRGGIPLLLARRTEELDKVRDEIVAAGGSAHVYAVDLTDPDSVSECVGKMLADHGGVDMLVNNAGRSIRRSIKLSYDRFHDFERTMALNYFAPVRLILALLPSMTERRFGHIVNVSSIGVQTNPPRFSAYVASKAALDAFSRVVSSELVGDGVTFTNVHMPLVRTPMIAPTKIYDRFPTLSPEQAATMLVEALESKPSHVGTRIGTLGVVAEALAPRVTDAILHTAYHAFPDSAAAAAAATAGSAAPVTTAKSAPDALSRGAVVLMRLLPGVHW